MKPYLPFNVLLLLACITTGSILLYNGVFREQTASTLVYRYPEVDEVSQTDTVALPEPERIDPDEWGDAEKEPDGAVQEPQITSVRFPLDINEATVEQLKFIPRVGDVMSQRIVQYREELGGYSDLEQLRDIKGIGDSTYEHLYAYLYIAEELEETDSGG